jgi:hypothetical protein
VALPKLAVGIDPSEVIQRSVLNLNSIHQPASSMAFDPHHDILAISGPNPEDPSYQATFSIWDVSDEAGLPKNLHTSSPKNVRASRGWLDRLSRWATSPVPTGLMQKVRGLNKEFFS